MKACSQVNSSLSPGTSQPREGQPLQSQQGPRCHSIKIQKMKGMVNTRGSQEDWAMGREREGLTDLGVSCACLVPCVAQRAGYLAQICSVMGLPFSHEAYMHILQRQGQAKYKGSSQVDMPRRPGWWAHLALPVGARVKAAGGSQANLVLLPWCVSAGKGPPSVCSCVQMKHLGEASATLVFTNF